MQLTNNEAERAMVGSAILDPSVVDHAIDNGILVADFADNRNSEIWESIVNLRDAGLDIDYLTIEADLAKRGAKESVGSSYITGITDAVPSSSNWRSYCDILIHLGKIRRASEGLGRALSRIESCDNMDASELSGMIDAVSVKLESSDGMTEGWFDKLQRIQTDPLAGLLDTGLRDLDPYSPARGEFVIVAARPSTGKTALAIDILDRVSESGLRCLFFSLEMSRAAIDLRRVSRASGVRMDKMRQRGALLGGDYDKIGEAATRLKKLPVKIVDNVYNVSQIEGMVRREKLRGKLDLAFIDYLQIMRIIGKDRYNSTTETVSSISRMAHSLGVTTVLLSQLSRRCEQENREPVLSDLRDSGAIEEAADIVWFLHRPDRYEGGQTMQIIAAKNRNGAIGRTCLAYDPGLNRFSSDKFSY